jgi:hypothetical protein
MPGKSVVVELKDGRVRLGCNDKRHGRYYCPERQWFMPSQCPFLDRRECRNYKMMCGGEI